MERLEVGTGDDHLVHDQLQLRHLARLDLGRLALVAEAARARREERPQRQRVALAQDGA
jgi:hypothetical protein